MHKKHLVILGLLFLCAAQAAAEVSERSTLDIQLAKVQRRSLLKERTKIDERLQQVFKKRVLLERKKRAIEEEKLMYLLSRRLCSDAQPAAAKPKVYSLPRPSDAGDRLDKELDNLLDKQNKLMERGLTLENEMKEDMER